MRKFAYSVLFLFSCLQGMEEETVSFETADGKIFQVKKTIVDNLRGIQELISGVSALLSDQPNIPIPLNETVKTKAFEAILEFYESDVKNLAFFNDCSQKKLINIINAAHYLDCELISKLAYDVYKQKYVNVFNDEKCRRRHQKLLVDVDRAISDDILKEEFKYEYVISSMKADYAKSTFKEYFLSCIPFRQFHEYYENTPIDSFAISPKGSYLVCAVNRISCLYDIKQNLFKKKLLSSEYGNYGKYNKERNRAFSDDESLYAQIYFDSAEREKQDCPGASLTVWKTKTGDVLFKKDGNFKQPGFSADNRYLVAVKCNAEYTYKDSEAWIYVWSLNQQNKNIKKKFLTLSSKAFKQSYAFDSQGNIAYLKNRTTLGLWLSNDDREIEISCGSEYNNTFPYLFRFSPDDSKLVFLTTDLNKHSIRMYNAPSIKMYDISTGKLSSFTLNNVIKGLRFSFDSQYIVISDYKNHYIFNVNTLEKPEKEEKIGELFLVGNTPCRFLELGYEQARVIDFKTGKKRYMKHMPNFSENYSFMSPGGKFFCQKFDVFTSILSGPFIDSIQLEEDLNTLSSQQAAFVRSVFKRKEGRPCRITKNNKLPSGKIIPIDSPVGSPLLGMYKSLPYMVRKRLHGRIIKENTSAILIRGIVNDPDIYSSWKSKNILNNKFLE